MYRENCRFMQDILCVCLTGAAACSRPAPAEWGEEGLLWVPELSASSVQLSGNTSLCWSPRLLTAPHTCQQLRRLVCAHTHTHTIETHWPSPISSSFYVLLTEQHFPEVVGSEEFLNLGMEQVSSLIASDKLTIPTEEKVHTRPAQYVGPH